MKLPPSLRTQWDHGSCMLCLISFKPSSTKGFWGRTNRLDNGRSPDGEVKLVLFRAVELKELG